MTSFDDDEEVVVVGRSLPRLVSIAPMDGFNVAVTWHAGTRAKEREIVDLAPLVARYKVYAPLRDDPDLFRTVRLHEHRYGVTWGDGSIDMGASTIADVSDEAMTADDFSAFMDRHNFTLDRVAAELGISRRMAAYYKKEHRVPRTVALACRYIDSKSAQMSGDIELSDGFVIDGGADHIRTLAAIAKSEGEPFTSADVKAAIEAKRAVDAAFGRIKRTEIGKVFRVPDDYLAAPAPANDVGLESLDSIKELVAELMAGQSADIADVQRIAAYVLRHIEITQIVLNSSLDPESSDHAQLG